MATKKAHAVELGPNPVHTNSAARRLVEFAAALELADLPGAAIDQAKRCWLDCLGVALTGSREPAAVRARAVASSGAGQATLWGTPRWATVFEAAVINGCAAHALDYDDTYSGPVPIHCSATIIPALLAMAESRGLGGSDLLLAFVIGAESAARLGEALGQSHLTLGWHGTGTMGTLGAAVGVGKLLGLRHEQLARCLALGAAQAAGLVQTTGTMCKPLNAGKAAGNGVIAAQLAEAGFTAPVDVLDLPRGFGALFSRGYAADRAIEGLGDEYRILRIGFKPHACCAQAHATFDAVVELRRAHGLRPEDVEHVEARLPPVAVAAVDVPAPKDGTESRFSLPFCVSLGLVSDDALPDRFGDAMTQDPRLRTIWPKVRVVPDPALEKGQSKVTVLTADGRRFTSFTGCARGRAGNPLSREELERKFAALAEPVIGAGQSARVLELVADLERVDAAGMARLLSTAQEAIPARQPVAASPSSSFHRVQGRTDFGRDR